MKYSLRKERGLWMLINRQTGLISTAKDKNLISMLINKFGHRFSFGKRRFDGIKRIFKAEQSIFNNIPHGYDSEGNSNSIL